MRRDDRVVEGNGLENRRARKGTVGSNPTLSAKRRYRAVFLFCAGEYCCTDTSCAGLLQHFGRRFERCTGREYIIDQ